MGTSSLACKDNADSDESETSVALADKESRFLTTVMMRNMPNNMRRQMLLDLIDSQGFKGSYDFVYLPVDFKSHRGLGYSFINFSNAETAERFKEHFSGFCDWSFQSDKVCEMTYSEGLQGLNAHIERYRNSPVMHESMPEECQPLLFVEGERVPFPKPTKRIRAPHQSPKK